MIQTITTNHHTIQNGALLKSAEFDFTQTSGQMKICIDEHFVINVIESKEVSHLLKFVS